MCIGCSTKAEYLKKVMDSQHLDISSSSSNSDEANWMVEYAWMGAKGLFAASPLILLGSVFCCAYEDEEVENKKRKKDDDFKAGG